MTDRYPDIDADRFESTTLAAIRNAFPDAVVVGWDDLVEQMDNDPDDRHVAAAAVAGGAEMIVTLNLGDFAGTVLTDRGIRVVTPGTFVGELLDDLPDRVVAALVEMADRKRRPPMMITDVLDALSRVPDLVSIVKRLRELLD